MSTPKPRILLVVPDLTRQRLVRTALSRGGALVTTEEAGEAALRRCALAPPAAVIMAVVMPGLNGLQVLARLRTNYPSLPVYLLDDDSAGQRMDVKGLAAGAAAVFQSAQAGAWANQVVKDLETAAVVGQASAWIASPPPGPSAYLVEEHATLDGLPLYPDSDDLLGANADHLIHSPPPSAEPAAPRSTGVADDTEPMTRRVVRPGRESPARLRGSVVPMDGLPLVESECDQMKAPPHRVGPLPEGHLVPLFTAFLERQLPVILADLRAHEHTKAIGVGRSPPDLMPALRSINEGFRTQMTRQINWRLQQIATESEAQAHALVTAVVVQHLAPVRQQLRLWRGLAVVALVGIGVLGGTVVGQFV